jgi:hypothetical protein
MPTSTSRPSGRYADPGYRRLALAPGLIAALALLIGALDTGAGWFTVIRYVVAIFAAIVAVFAVQAKQWWWLPLFAAIVVAWNPVFPVDIPNPWWQGAHYVAAIVFLLAGWLIKVTIPEDQRR